MKSDKQIENSPQTIGEKMEEMANCIDELESVCKRVIRLIENNQAYDKNAAMLLKQAIEKVEK